MRGAAMDLTLDLAILLNCFALLLAANIGVWAHAGAGLSLAALLSWHIARHRRWFKALFRAGKPGKGPRNRFINTALLIVAAVTVLSGGALALAMAGGLFPGGGYPARAAESGFYFHLKILHRAGAILTLPLAAWHLAVHLKWLAAAARSGFKKEAYGKQ